MKSAQYLNRYIYFVLAMIFGLLLVFVSSLPVSAAAGISTSVSPSSLTEGLESYPGYIDVADITSTVSDASIGTSVTITGSVSGGCLMATQSKGPVIYTGSASASITVIGSGSNTNLGVYVADNSTYQGTRTCIVSFSAGSTQQPEFNSISISSVSVSVADDEPAPAPKPVATPTPVAAAPTTQVTVPTETPAEKPATPKPKLVDSEGKELAPSGVNNKVMFKKNDPIILSGVTVPSGLVKLYIYSEPQEVEVTADGDGNWSYTIASIEPGDHRVEAEVTDPETGETSDRAEVLAFQVAQAETTEDTENNPTIAENTEPLPGGSNSIVIYAVAGVFTVILLTLLIVSKMHPIRYITHLIKH